MPIHTALVLALALASALLAGCISAPLPLQGDWPRLTPREASMADYGAKVRWGGRLVSIEREGTTTCFELIGEPLAANGQPDGSRSSLGPFRACRQGEFAPEVFRPNRRLTVTGRIDAFIETGGASGATQRPRLAADAIVLWP